MDHQQYLGDTLEDILTEKAGILRDGVSCVAANQGSKKLDKKLGELCKDAGAPLLKEGELWFARVAGGRRGEPFMIFKGLEGERKLPMPRLPGRHQVRNAALAIACAEALAPEFDIFDSAIKLGLSTVKWPARLQQLTTGPLADVVNAAHKNDKGAWELWLDGGHNEAAATALAQHARGWRDKDLYLVYGAINSREPLEYLKPFEGKVAGFRGVTIPGQENAWPAQHVTERAQALRMPNADEAETVLDAVRAIVDNSPEGGRILIAGSLYLAGEVLKDNA